VRKALLVGAGEMGREWARTLRQNDAVQLVGWVDIVPEVVQSATLELDNGAVSSDLYIGTDLAAAITRTQPDFVVDVTIPSAHCSVTTTALAAGLPVLGEKPMSATMEEALAMVAAADSAGKLFMVSQNRRYNPHMVAFKQLIQQQLGTIGIISADFSIGAHFTGFRAELAHPLLLDMAIHSFDIARFLSESDPVAVYCEEYNPHWSWFPGQAAAVAIFEFANGLRFTYQGSWCSEGNQTSWEASWRAVGTHGSALWNGFTDPTAEIVTSFEGFSRTVEQRQATMPGSDFRSGIGGALQDFLFALDTGNIPMNECHDNIKTIAMAIAAIESAATGRKVPVRW